MCLLLRTRGRVGGSSWVSPSPGPEPRHRGAGRTPAIKKACLERAEERASPFLRSGLCLSLTEPVPKRRESEENASFPLFCPKVIDCQDRLHREEQSVLLFPSQETPKVATKDNRRGQRPSRTPDGCVGSPCKAGLRPEGPKEGWLALRSRAALAWKAPKRGTSMQGRRIPRPA